MRDSEYIGVAVLAAALLVPVFYSRTSRAATAKTAFEKWGSRFGVRSETLKKIAKHESGMNPNAKRLVGGDLARGGAWGLMQVTASTAQGLVSKFPPDDDIARNLAIFDLDPTVALLSPDINVMFGAFYFSRLLARFRGDELAAIGAYNRGARGMSDLIASGVQPGALQYVQRVMAA